MTFAAPLFLIAALAGIIPVVLHMINRRKSKELPFSTLRFLRISVQKTRRRKMVHDWLLMLLRVLVLLLIALGLARPAITNLASLWGGGGNLAVVIVLDNSASMGLIDQDRVRFETARRAALQIVDELKDGDQVALILTGGPKFPEQGRLDRTHEKVIQMLDQCRVSYERADLGVNVQQARELLSDAEAANKQIYVLTDQQVLSWDSLAAAGTAAKKIPWLDIPIIFVDCNRTPKPNVAVTGISLEAPVPVAGLPITAGVELLNTSAVDQQRHVELLIDSIKTAGSPVLNVPAGERLKHNFQFAFRKGGLHRCEVRLVGEDGSKLDDRRFFAMTVDQGIPVAIVKPKRHEIPYLEDTFYLEQALSPGKSGDWAIRTTMLTAGDLLGEPLENYKVIFCVNLPAPDAEVAGRLSNYVSGGGSIVWVCGNNVDVAAYNRMNKQAGDVLLPAPLLEVRTPGIDGDRDSWSVAFLDKSHPALKQLVEPASLYRSVLVYKYVKVDVADTAGTAVPLAAVPLAAVPLAAVPLAAVPLGGAHVLARLDDGDALLLERPVGQGRVLMLTTGGHIGWSNLPLRPIFLPLLVRMVFDLAGAEQAGRSVIAGSPLVLPLDEKSVSTNVEILPPTGETIRLSLKAEEAGKHRAFRYADTHRVGIYLLRLLGARAKQVAYSVNLDGEEAEPTKIERQELEERFAGTPLVFAENPDDLSSTFAWLREGKSLWWLFLSGVLIALVFETFLSNRLTAK